ncbi:zinc-dependent alcohol dehydrogenase [Sphingomonas solaris]|uniref:Zinc-binding dehydrogenase n=1 Tax=Alterirhizorhabdus solaris TaxID=2529389 RepID=A0A558R524_9SPHN|nr:zinc-binding dehydrogenase [Sphingomonas solaris]TVV74476.1 zinc-binding dehydrogenase [Sphingomonas solaris]
MTRQQVARLQGARDISPDTSDIPTPGPRDVVIRVAVCGICGTDLAFYRHGSTPKGAVLGHEFSGRVVAIGTDVTGVAVGRRVVVNPMHDGMGLGQVPGAFAQYVRLGNAELGRNLFELPDAITDEAGALIEPFAVGLHAVNNAKVTPDDRTVIYGAGTIGLCVLAALRARGVRDILVIDISDRRLEFARRMGATAIHNSSTGSAPAFVGSHFGTESLRYAQEPVGLASVVFDCAGVRPALRDAVHSLAPRGRLVIVADPHDNDLPNLRFVMLRELVVMGALAYESEFPEVIDLIASGKIDLSPIVTHRFPLSRITEAFRIQIDPEEAVKVLVLAD